MRAKLPTGITYATSNIIPISVHRHFGAAKIELFMITKALTEQQMHKMRDPHHVLTLQNTLQGYL